MKVIFLDIDGVLNSMWLDNNRPKGPATEAEKKFLNEMRWKFRLHEIRDIDPKAIALLNQLAIVPDIKIVITSDWRLSSHIKDIEKLFQFHGLVIPVIGGTIDWQFYRDQEILDWLKNHPEIDKFVIFDDNQIDGFESFIKTNRDVGISQENINKALNWLM